MDKDIQKERTNFALGLFGASLAMLVLKDDLAQISIPMGTQKLPLLGGIIFFILFLAAAIYLYALDFVRFSFGKYKDSWIFRWIIPTANFFYSAALFFPILVLLASIFAIPVINNFARRSNKIIWIFDVILGIAWLVVSFINATFKTN